jgi:predicted nucleotidyltransferase
MLTRKIAIEKVNSFISDLRSIGYAPTEAWVFGSVINGHVHPYSDIDLALWDRNFTGILHIDGEKLKNLLVKFDEIELHTYPTGLSEKENPFIGIIRKTGERIL